MSKDKRIAELEATIRLLLKAIDGYKRDLTYETNWRLMSACINAKEVLKARSEA
jgi:hypothetical protein